MQVIAAKGCVTWSGSWVNVLGVNKWEALKLFLVQVGYKLLIWGGQLWGVACEKAIKVLRITPTLPWRGETWRNGVSLMEGERGDKKKRQTTTKREKTEVQLKHGVNQSNRSQPKTVEFHWSKWKQRHLSFIIGDDTDEPQLCVRVVTNGRGWLFQWRAS